MLLYRLFLSVLAPLYGLWALWQWLCRREDGAAFRARMGLSKTRSEGPSLWVHAASNGELASVAGVLREILAKSPDLTILVTANTASGVRLARSWGVARLHAQLAPVDTRWANRRILRRWRVCGLIIVEADLWPNRITQTAARNLPVIVLGARVSRKSARGWRRFSPLVARVLADVTWLLPQDQGSLRRLRRLGLEPSKCGPVVDLKALYSRRGLPGPDSALAAAFPAGTTWLAASTHRGDERLLLEAHKLAQARMGELRMILAPRHPRRAGEIRQIAEALGLEVAQRSLGDPPRKGAIYLADTMGEMAQFYDLASVCFVAGSLTDRGGHTPYEPIAHDCVIIHGPHTSNFQRIYRMLDAAGGAFQANSAADLAFVLMELRDRDRRITARGIARNLATAKGSAPEIAAQILGKLPDLSATR